MSDLISRQAAIDGIQSLIDDMLHRFEVNYGAEKQRYVDCLDVVSRLPSSQPERTGKWIEDGYNHYKAVCSECGEPCATYVMGTPRDKFCKWCGARMEEHNETD